MHVNGDKIGISAKSKKGSYNVAYKVFSKANTCLTMFTMPSV